VVLALIIAVTDLSVDAVSMLQFDHLAITVILGCCSKGVVGSEKCVNAKG
jgi:hypothetical protein